jgi:hypothetical protein
MPTVSNPVLERLLQDRPDLFSVNSKFAPKLSFVDRCSVFAFWKAGIERRTLAAAFGINRGTVNYIVTPSSPHYKNVRKEFKDLGVDEFMRRYLTEEWAQKVEAAKGSYETQFADDDVKKMRSMEVGPNPRAKSKAGEHLVKYPDIGNTIGPVEKIEVVFGTCKSLGSPPFDGWFIKSPSGGDMGNAKHCATSAAAFKAFLEDNMAEEA